MKIGASPVSLVTVLCALLLVPLAVFSEGVERSTSISVEGAYYIDDNKGFGVGDGGFAPVSYTPVDRTGSFPAPDDGRDLGSGWGAAEIQFLLTHKIVVPFLAGSGALTSGNNVAFAFTGALSPVSVRAEARATLTPIAFLNLFAGGMIGTGWDIGVFNGMGLNTDGSGVASSSSFQGMVVKSWIGGTFQFDLAALLPGEWTHVVVLLRPRFEYARFTGAGRSQAWLWEADDGENFNGFKIYGAYFLGYQMPRVLNTVGILVETEQNLGYVKDLSPMASGGWGSDFVEIALGPALNFSLSKSSSLTVLIQIVRKRLYDGVSVFANYYENRHAVGTYWDLYRVGFSYEVDL
jgi:hypothetical protein